MVPNDTLLKITDSNICVEELTLISLWPDTPNAFAEYYLTAFFSRGYRGKVDTVSVTLTNAGGKQKSSIGSQLLLQVRRSHFRT